MNTLEEEQKYCKKSDKMTEKRPKWYVMRRGGKRIAILKRVLSAEIRQSVPNKAIRAAAFGIVGPDRWNKLPELLRESASLNIFKRDLKTHPFNN